jgi:hypothetical protein
MNWLEATVELNGVLQTIRNESKVTKKEVLWFVDNAFGDDKEETNGKEN